MGHNPKISMTAALTILALSLSPLGQGAPEIYVQKIPGALAEFRMVKLPDGKITTGGKTVTIKDLWYAETELTWDVFDIWAFRLDQSEADQAAGVDAKSRPSKPYGAPDRGFGHAGYPALSMTRHSAEEFCRWLSAKTKITYRLPTAAEWEYAARAGATENPSPLGEYAWYWDNAEDKTHAVKSLKPNAFGLHDMLGNVGEWVSTPADIPTLAGGHFLSRKASVGFDQMLAQTPRWNESDPQNPKSRWWLANGPFAGFRVVFVGSSPSVNSGE